MSTTIRRVATDVGGTFTDLVSFETGPEGLRIETAKADTTPPDFEIGVLNVLDKGGVAAADIDYAALRELPSDQVIKALVAIPGIGTWTAEVYAMFSLGRADVFAPGDLALQEAAKLIFDLEARPTEKALRDRARAWAPWRSVAARIMWAYYKQVKQREGIR